VSESNIDKMMGLLESEEVDTKVRQSIAETLTVIIKQIGFRKTFLRQKYYDVLTKVALKLLDEIQNPNEGLLEISQSALLNLITVNSLNSSRVYIPGETNISERLRKSSFECGTYFLVTHIYENIKDIESNYFKLTIQILQEKYLNIVDL